MADDEIVLNPGVGGDALDTESLVYPGGTRHRERVQITGTELDDIAAVLDVDPDADDHGAVVRIATNRQPIAGLSFSQTLGAFGSHVTDWVDIRGTVWLDVHAKLAAASAVTALVEFTNAADPNNVAPGANDIVRPISTTLGGSALGGIDEPSFGIPAQMQWARISVTDITGGQDIDVQVDSIATPPTIAQVPIATTLTDDFRAGIVKAALTGKQPDGDWEDVFVSGSDPGNSSSTPLGAGATFTGTAKDTTGFIGGMVVVNADADAAADGLRVEFSESDTFTNIHRSLVFDYTANQEFVRFFPTMQGEYYRVVLENGAAPQTSLVLRTELLTTQAQQVAGSLDATLNASDVAVLARAVAAGITPDGDFENAPLGGMDPNNSSTTPLLAGGTFSGTFTELAVGYASTSIFVKTDVDSATGGLKIIHSSDGVDDERIVPLTYDSSANPQGVIYLIPASTRFLRLEYENNPDDNQGSFILSVKHHVTPFQLPALPLNTGVTGGSVAVIGKNALIARDDSGTWDNVTRGTEGVRVSVFEHETSTPIRPVSTLKTGRANVTSAVAVALPSIPLTDRATVSFTNIGDVNCNFSESSVKIPGQADALLPLTSREFDLDEGEQIFFQAEDAGGSTSTSTRDGASTQNNSGVVSPNNLLLSDDARATFDDQGDSVEVTGFTAAAALDEIAQIKIQLEARKAASPTFETVTHQSTHTNTGTGGTSIAVPSVTGGDDMFYIAFIANGSTGPQTVGSVTGLGLTWTKIAGGANSSSDGALSMWRANGDATTGTVTANFNGTVDESAIAVLRYSGVDQASPIQASVFAEAAGGGSNAWSLSSIAGTGTFGRFVAGINGINRDPIFTNPTTLRVDLVTGDTNLEVYDDVAGATNTASGTHSAANPDWVAGAVTLRPAASVDPIINVSYEISGVPGSTSLDATLTATSDTMFEVDITGDRAWVFADIPNLDLILDATTLGAADAEVDWVGLEITESETGNSTIISFSEVGGIL